jgi:transcriptional regulator with XRE-family HTH domain
MKADRIRRIRKRLGENQHQFGRRLGVPQNTISRWETNGLPETGVHQLVRAELRRLELDLREKKGPADAGTDVGVTA